MYIVYQSATERAILLNKAAIWQSVQHVSLPRCDTTAPSGEGFPSLAVVDVHEGFECLGLFIDGNVLHVHKNNFWEAGISILFL